MSDRFIDSAKNISASYQNYLEAALNNGSWINPNIEIFRTEKGLSVKASATSGASESLVRIPLEELLFLSDFELTLKNDLITVEAHSIKSEGQAQLLLAMIDCYNETQSFQHWQNSSPWLTLYEHSSVLKKLISFQHLNKAQEELISLVDQKNFLELSLMTFLKSRAINVRPEHQKMVGRQNVKKPEKCLIPIIDLFNHSNRARPFSISGTPLPASLRAYGDLRCGEEVFVKYNLLDLLDSYLVYGFVDKSIRLLHSAPMKVESSIGTIKLMGNRAKYQGKLPPPFNRHPQFFPGFSKVANEYLVGNIIIPSPEKLALLRSILAAILKNFGVDTVNLQKEVLQIEREIIFKNIHYWQELRSMAQTVPPGHQIHLLIEAAQQHLAEYLDRASKMGQSNG